VDSSRQYGGLQFNNTEGGEQFIVVLGLHISKVWRDITDIGTNETFGNVVEEYHHYCKDLDSYIGRCRCKSTGEATIHVDNGFMPANEDISRITHDFPANDSVMMNKTCVQQGFQNIPGFHTNTVEVYCILQQYGCCWPLFPGKLAFFSLIIFEIVTTVWKYLARPQDVTTFQVCLRHHYSV
jgi:hypothetical protein